MHWRPSRRPSFEKAFRSRNHESDPYPRLYLIDHTLDDFEDCA